MRRRHPRSRFALPLLLLVTTLTATVAGAPPAAADPGDVSGFAVVGQGQVTFIHYPASQTLEVRLSGSVPASSRVVGAWTAVMAGHRQQTATSLPVAVQQTYGPDTGYTLYQRLFFPTDSASGSLTVDLAYTAAGSYVAVRSVHTIAWSPATGMQSAGADVG